MDNDAIMQIIRSVLNTGMPPVMTLQQLALLSHLSYLEVNMAITSHIRSEFGGDPFTQEFRLIGHADQIHIYSARRCDSPVGDK
jgi:hypothetical protein